MQKPRYANASWRLLVRDVATGDDFYALEPDTMALTGSTRKLFSVGLALNTLGADHTIATPVYRTDPVDERGRLDGNLVLVGGGDLVFGGRRTDANTVHTPTSTTTTPTGSAPRSLPRRIRCSARRPRPTGPRRRHHKHQR